MQHFAANGIDLAELAGLPGRRPRSARSCRSALSPGRAQTDGVNTIIELSGILSIAENTPVAVAADHCKPDDVGLPNVSTTMWPRKTQSGWSMSCR